MSDQPISIIIVEDEPEFRRRFGQIVENEPSMKLVGVAANTREAQASTICRMMSRSSELAVMSRKVISSAPWAS